MGSQLRLLCLCLELVALVGLSSGLPYPSSAHPEYALDTPSLELEKRPAGGCRACTLYGEAARERKYAPQNLEDALQATRDSPEFPSLSWSHFVRVYEGGEGGSVEVKGEEGKVKVCDGWVRQEGEGEKQGGVVIVVDNRASAQVQYLLFSTAPQLAHNSTIWFTCDDPQPHCFTLLSKGVQYRSRRNVQQDAHPSHPHPSHDSEGVGAGVSWGVGVCVGALGIIGLLATLAMCAHGSQVYDPEIPKNRTSEVASTSKPIAMKTESQTNLQNNGSTAQDARGLEEVSKGKPLTQSTDSPPSSEGKLPSSQNSGSQDPLIQPSSETETVRSKDPLPGMPTLEAADDLGSSSVKATGGEGEGGKEEEEERGYASVRKEKIEKDGYAYVDKIGGANVDENDEAGYAYATVGGANGEGSARPDEDGIENDRDDGENKDKASTLPPYGKVTRHMLPVSSQGSYSEVRTTNSPMLLPGRNRALTEPIEPPGDQRAGVREERSFTESAAHLPLPQIPKLEVNEDVYDSIPDEIKEGGASGGAASAKPPLREILYESVDEAKGDVEEQGVEEDMYESVPEDMRPPGSPSTSGLLSPSSPVPPPPRSPSLTFKQTETSASPPHSKDGKGALKEDGKKKGKGHSKDKDEQKKHKVLSKTKSESGPEQRGRSLSSLFSRKKTGSIGGGSASPKVKKEKDQHEPLPQVPAGSPTASSKHLLPPSPPPMPVPLPPDEEAQDDLGDGAYDVIEVLNPRGAALLKGRSLDAKAKSASLPSSMRSAGVLVHIPNPYPKAHEPLPKVPEESAGGLVSRVRVKEIMDPEYDTVVMGQVLNEPSYDSVQLPEVEGSHDDESTSKLEPAEPLARGGAEPERGETPTKYAKVTSHTVVEKATSPDNSGHPPEHDDLGYAVIPAHLKMRKRAMSDAMKKKEQTAFESRPKSDATIDDPGNDVRTPSQAAKGASGSDTLRSPKEPEYESVTDEMRGRIQSTDGEKETPYASVDMAAKRISQMIRQQSGGMDTLDSNAGRSHSPSPNPPPLPQQGDLGDLSEFEQPPIPVQREEALQLIEPNGPNDPPYSRITNPPTASGTFNPYNQIDVLPDPPYASIKKRSEDEADGNQPAEAEGDSEDEENPYATVDNVREELGTAQKPNDPPYAKVKKGRVVEDDEDPGYDKTGLKLPASEESERVDEDEASGYNTIGDRVSQPPVSQPPVPTTTTTDTTQKVNGERTYEGEENDTYDRLDHGFGNAATCRANRPSVASGSEEETESAVATIDFRSFTSPQLVVTPADVANNAENGISIDTEEKTIDFTE